MAFLSPRIRLGAQARRDLTVRATRILAAREARPRSGPRNASTAGIHPVYGHTWTRATRGIGIAWLGAMVLVATHGQVAFGYARPATVVVRQQFNARFGIPIEGVQVFLEVSRVRGGRVLINRDFEVERHPIWLLIPPGRYELTGYVREGGPMICVEGSTCSQELGPPIKACSYRLKLVNAQVLSLLVTANSRRCSISPIG